VPLERGVSAGAGAGATEELGSGCDWWGCFGSAPQRRSTSRLTILPADRTGGWVTRENGKTRKGGTERVEEDARGLAHDGDAVVAAQRLLGGGGAAEDGARGAQVAAGEGVVEDGDGLLQVAALGAQVAQQRLADVVVQLQEADLDRRRRAHVVAVDLRTRRGAAAAQRTKRGTLKAGSASSAPGRPRYLAATRGSCTLPTLWLDVSKARVTARNSHAARVSPGEPPRRTGTPFGRLSGWPGRAPVSSCESHSRFSVACRPYTTHKV